ncbi:disease resistance protein RGA2-like [Aegilops tauschii subsp. strangulata]|uniref:disease resistance protein RGA2-like n=1 Tax=Aegilops tauschii subsp. strangulata TaxID=200361 RepID=UPI00098B317E|nr:putative disease resistance RPP13-like protein 1 [Aegilops tauschii subsp. strangulata]
MEVAISTVAGELVSRFISFLKNKYHSLSHAQSEKMVERLQHLLMRVSIVVEEADGRYITNSGMLLQLKMLSGAMYNGHRVLDTLRYQNLHDIAGFEKVSINDSSRSSLYLAIPFERSQTKTEMDDKAMRLDSDGALESLEIVVTNMTEFAVLLGGCERMSRMPYDVYFYSNNFMFSRHAQKQRLLNFLLGHNDSPGDHALAVLPIIGGVGVGKKTLVAHVCGDERVRSRFSSILHLNGDSLLTILDHGRTMFGTTLVVIEFNSDVGDDDWKRFHSFPIRISRGSKIIIISKLKTLGRFGSVQPIFLSVLSYDELRYLFKTLAFGSVDSAEHPRLVQIADEFAKELHSMQGTLVATNMYADVLRRNLDVQFWLCILDKGRRFIKRNLSIYGVHPTTLLEKGHPVDITDVALHPLSMRRYTINVSIKEELPSVTMGELLTDPNVRPKEDFILISWESRMPPHTSFARLVTSNAQEAHEGNALPGRKRREVPP